MIQIHVISVFLKVSFVENCNRFLGCILFIINIGCFGLSKYDGTFDFGEKLTFSPTLY